MCHIRPSRLATLVFLTAVSLPAQSTTLEVNAPIVATAQYLTLVRDTIPAGVFTQPLAARAESNQGLFMNVASTRVEPLTNGVRWSASAYSSIGGALLESGQVRLIVRGAAAGTVRVTATGSASADGSTQAQVDVGGDGSVEVTAGAGTVARAIRTCIGQELRILLTVRVSSVYAAAADMTLQVTFEPGLAPVQVAGYGAACGLTFEASDLPDPFVHQMAFTAGGASANGLVWIAFGVGRASIPIPGSPCSLFTVPSAIVGVPADPQGAARLAGAIPGPLHGVAMHAQALTVDVGGIVRASQGLELTFRDC